MDPDSEHRLTLTENVRMMNKLGGLSFLRGAEPKRLPKGARHTLLLPPRSMAGQLTLDQHIGVRIPGGQPIESIS